MKALFISANSPFMSIGGIERYVINLINFFKLQEDIETYLILPTTQENHTVIDGNMTIYYDESLQTPRKLNSKILSVKGQKFSNLIEKLIKEEGIDIICAENLIGSVPPVYSMRLNMIAAHYKIPLMLRQHTYAEKPIQIELINQLTWDHISCVSKSVAGDCFQKGTDIDKISTDYLGVNTSNFNSDFIPSFDLNQELGFNEDIKIILTAGRIITGTKNMLKEKGMINLIEAFSRISPAYPNLRLVIGVGRASAGLKDDFELAYEMLIGYIKIHGIEEKTVVKMFELDQMPNVYRGAEMLVLTAEKNETFGQTFIEAMACGTPVIGAKTGGIPEIISDGRNGFLVQPNDPIILAQKIELILNDDELRNNFINEGIKTVNDSFTADQQFANFNNLLKKVAYESSLRSS